MFIYVPPPLSKPYINYVSIMLSKFHQYLQFLQLLLSTMFFVFAFFGLGRDWPFLCGMLIGFSLIMGQAVASPIVDTDHVVLDQSYVSINDTYELPDLENYLLSNHGVRVVPV